MDLHSVTTLMGGVNATVASAKIAVELATKAKNHDVKEEVGKVLDGILNLKATLLDLEEENRELKRKLEQRANVKRVPEFGYWFKDSEDEPLCPRCYEGDGKLVYLAPRYVNNEGAASRTCNVCHWSKVEVRATESARRSYRAMDY